MKTPLFVSYFCALWLVSVGGGEQSKANAAELQTTSSHGVSPGSGSLTFCSETGLDYALVKSRSLNFSDPHGITTVAGDGGEKTLSFARATSDESAAFFSIESEEQPAAPDAVAFATLVQGKTIRGINFAASSQRWNALGLVGESGGRNYQRTDATTGLATLTFDESSNNPSVMRHELSLTFVENVSQNVVAAAYAVVAHGQAAQQFSLTVDLTGNSFAPVPAMLEFILDGRTATTLLASTVFSGNGHFVFNGSDSGDWSAILVDADRLRITQTYDEGSKNPNGYREYEDGALGFFTSGTVTLRE